MQAIFAALTGGPLERPALLAFGTGLATLAAGIWVLRRKLGLGNLADG